ncbi:hypothetical protein EIP91_003348 [Steccherinum ochraceum]|uniref:Protein kinase domain-containing protein n=1 Tax=Steccherinum ochraceum TaxID=92696 RepID=A0A4V2MW61_9APHY|nr:hypothetical protein EIP91_003348 [Steccherinum ochraceum]
MEDRKRRVKVVAMNAFSEITLSGLQSTPRNRASCLKFIPPPPAPLDPETKTRRYQHPAYMSNIPDEACQASHKPPRSRLPEAESLTLALSLGKQVGYGRVGRVYEVEVDETASSSSLSGRVLPPLVVKVSRRGMASALLPEAQTYADMERLQGNVIPRCYGVFTTTIKNKRTFLPWDEEGLDEDGCTPPDYVDANLMKGPLPPNAVTILVLERVGSPIELDQQPQRTLDELRAMYTDIASMGILHCDIRQKNILYAPAHSPIPVSTSPNWTRPYRFRIIDFHKSRTTNINKYQIAVDYYANLVRFIDGLVNGDVFEPWHRY